jgi:hypothetical protein
VPALGLLLVSLMAGASGRQKSVASADSARCTLGEAANALDSAHILLPGKYTLTLEATGGSSSGQRASGLLELWPTSAADRSPTWPAERPPAGDTVATPLYGATDVDWHKVAALFGGVAPGESPHSTDVPSPDSRDPLHPGVLVVISNAKGTVSEALLVRTFENRRVAPPRMVLDGGGIVMRLLRFTKTGFEGEWGPWGVLDTGKGYFCIVRRGS